MTHITCDYAYVDKRCPYDYTGGMTKTERTYRDQRNATRAFIVKRREALMEANDEWPIRGFTSILASYNSDLRALDDE